MMIMLSFFILNSFAQEGSKYDAAKQGEYIRGFLIDETNDTIKGAINWKIHYRQQEYVAMESDNKDFRARSFRPNNVKYYELDNNTKWLSTKFTNLRAPEDNKRNDKETFLLATIIGPITVFNYNFYDASTNPPKNETSEYLQSPTGEVIITSSLLLGFKKKMADFVKDYPELASKITNKEKGYGMLGIYDIVREYNKWYLEKHPDFTIFKK